MFEGSTHNQRPKPPQPTRFAKLDPHTTTVKRKILIIDDDELVLDSLKILVKKYGYTTRVAPNGFEALELLDEEPFALLICDIRMPGINGLETVKAMRETARLDVNRSLPVIFISGFADSKLEKEAQQMGRLAYLNKPFDDSQIWHLLKIHLGD